jgi:excisionase family DNA binding protein
VSREITRDGDRLMTVRDVAHFLGLKPKGIYALVERRAIPFVRVSNRLRFLRADVLLWVQENRVPASENR